MSSKVMDLYRALMSTNEDATPAGPQPAAARTGTAEEAVEQCLSDLGDDGPVPMRLRLPWVAETKKESLPAGLLRDYIAYARQYCNPKLTQGAAEILHSHYTSLRNPTHRHSADSSPIATTRQLEALIRLSQARAKSCLRDYVLKEDAEDVLELALESMRQVTVDGGSASTAVSGNQDPNKKKARNAKMLFTEELRKTARQRVGGKVYEADLYEAAARAGVDVSVRVMDLVEDLRQDSKIIKHADKGYSFL